ncbi:MAG TPA: radical SAM protein [Stellaceae bacterium]|jgi:MoaA/NifB/PqqE/SkfB family radical SAM enzyme
MTSVQPAESNPRRYFAHIAAERGPVAEAEPVCLYLETTNRCNLLCTTCPRTFAALEPPADMSWELFTRIVDQLPRLARVVLHGVGEPMLVAALPRMIRYLKERGIYVLFNTNGTLLSERKGRELIESGLDELRVSLDGADRDAFARVRGRDMFPRILRNLRLFRAMQHKLAVEAPRVSLWLTGLKETIGQLIDFVRLADDLDVREVYLQRLVYFADGQGLAQADQALFAAGGDSEEERLVREAAELADRLGIAFNASGATDPLASLAPGEAERPWSLCRRPWSLMYITAHGRALPCCIAPFSLRGYDGFTLGDATQETLRDIWNGPRYRAFRSALLSQTPHAACAGCGLRWSL